MISVRYSPDDFLQRRIVVQHPLLDLGGGFIVRSLHAVGSFGKFRILRLDGQTVDAQESHKNGGFVQSFAYREFLTRRHVKGEVW